MFIYSLPKECSEISSLQPVAHVMVVETIKLETFKATTGILMPKVINFNKKGAASCLKWFVKSQPIKTPLYWFQFTRSSEQGKHV